MSQKGRERSPSKQSGEWSQAGRPPVKEPKRVANGIRDRNTPPAPGRKVCRRREGEQSRRPAGVIDDGPLKIFTIQPGSCKRNQSTAALKSTRDLR